MNPRPLLLLALLSSCGPLVEAVAPPLGVTEPLVLADAGTPPAPDAGGGASLLTGFPCEVRVVLELHCTGCHSTQTYLRGLLRRGDFLQPRTDTQLLGQHALERMQPGAAMPMPPAGYSTKPSAAEVAVIAAWVNAGMPAGGCGDALAR